MFTAAKAKEIANTHENIRYGIAVLTFIVGCVSLGVGIEYTGNPCMDTVNDMPFRMDLVLIVYGAFFMVIGIVECCVTAAGGFGGTTKYCWAICGAFGISWLVVLGIIFDQGSSRCKKDAAALWGVGMIVLVFGSVSGCCAAAFVNRNK